MPTSSYFNRELRPPARGFYERELGPLLRPDRNGWAKVKGGCPFHPSRSKTSFEVNVEHGGFVCHSPNCERKGDMFKFVMLRDGCEFKTAAKTLGCWREDLTREERMRLDERVARRRYEREQTEQAKEAERLRRLVLRDELHTTVRLYLRIDSELQQIGPQAEAHYWGALYHLLDDWRTTESDYCRASRLENPI